MVDAVKTSVFDVPADSLIIHQTNCIGVMGGGVALAVKTTFPSVFSEYCKLCANNAPADLLGKLQVIQVSDSLAVGNAFGQLEPGRGVMTDYQAWQDKLIPAIYKWLALKRAETGRIWSVHMPYRIGCGLAGGNQSVMLAMLEAAFTTHFATLVLHDWPPAP